MVVVMEKRQRRASGTALVQVSAFANEMVRGEMPLDFEIGAELLVQGGECTPEEFRGRIEKAIRENPAHSHEIVFTAMMLMADHCGDREFAGRFKEFGVWLGRIRDSALRAAY